jgi:hypothetical protein
MTDKDVLERAAQLMGGKVKGPYSRANISTQFKPYYIVVRKGKNGFTLMNSLFPLMGNRRKQQILTALATYIPNHEFGDNHPQAKLTVEKVRDIRGRIKGGQSLRQIAHHYNVDTSLIWQIKAGYIWRHVE